MTGAIAHEKHIEKPAEDSSAQELSRVRNQRRRALHYTDGGTHVLKSTPSRQRVTAESAFSDVVGTLEFFEDPDAPTGGDWSDI